MDDVLTDTDVKGIGAKSGENYTSTTVTLTGLKDYRKAIVSTEYDPRGVHCRAPPHGLHRVRA
jgi:hypothetical protein